MVTKGANLVAYDAENIASRFGSLYGTRRLAKGQQQPLASGTLLPGLAKLILHGPEGRSQITDFISTGDGDLF
jgi:hypothetical protein